MAVHLPTYVFEAARAFPELPPIKHSTMGCVRPAAGLALALAHLLAGHQFTGVLADLSLTQIYSELENACMELQVPISRLFAWANSLLIDPEETLTNEQFNQAVPVYLKGPGFRAHPYQRENAAWAAHRMGSVLALGCGVGKSATATLAAMAAGTLGKANRERCIIISPLNAMPQWEDYVPDLRSVYRNVAVISCDSLHHYTSLDTGEGGALIIDETHKLKNEDADRTGYSHTVRLRMDWAVGLTGTLLHTGCEGLLSMLDLACPGLGRFLDKYDFGTWLDAVARKKIAGRGFRRKLVIPPDSARERLQLYLARGAKSLDFESESVSTIFQVPGQTKTLEDLWAPPEWVVQLREQHRAKRAEELRAEGKEPPAPKEDGNEDTPYLWGPDMSWDINSGLMGLAMQDERERECFDWVEETFKRSLTYPDDVDEARKLLDAEIAATQTEQGILEELEEADASADGTATWAKTLKKKRKLIGLPHFSAIFWAMRKDGAVDRIIERVVEKRGEAKKVFYRWRYRPGYDKNHLPPGPKIQRAMRWLEDNPEEPAVIGAASVTTLNLMSRCLQEKGISYHLIRGGVPLKDRKAFVADFQKGNTRVMLVQQVAGSESVTLTRAATSILLDHDLSPDIYSQFLGRTRRQGQQRECEHYDYAFNSTQVERILALRRGETFDHETRHALEQTIQYSVAGVYMEDPT